MKKIMFALLPVIICFMSSCDTDRDDITQSQAELMEFNKMVQIGVWNISSYIENGNPRPHSYDGYTFSFNASNDLVAKGNSGIVNGTWRSNTDSGPGYENRKKVYLHIFFGDDEKLSDLTDSFIVISASPEEIKLEMLNNTSTSLVFKKN